MKKKLLKIILIASVLTALSIPGAVFANSTDSKATDENLKISTSYSPVITYDIVPNTGTMIATESESNQRSISFTTVATGVTDTDYIFGLHHVMTTGTTKGKKLTVTTTATASMWFEGDFTSSPALVTTGAKDTAIAYGTASSTSGTSTLVGTSEVNGSYRGITFHSCVYDLTLYELKTSEAVQVS